MSFKSRLIDILTEYRSWVLVGVGLPAGYAFDGVMRLGQRVRERLASPGRHDARVAEVQAQVRRWASLPVDKRRPLCTDRRTWMSLSTRFEPKHRWQRIRMGGLRDVLSIDQERGTVTVEPFVTVGQLTRYLVPRGHMLAVHLEIADATIGGLALAAGMTTHSHRAGMLGDTVVAWEVVLGDGRKVRATATENPDLFHALPWSHGTLGLVVSLELRIIPVTAWVRLGYRPVRGQEALCRELRALATAENAPTFLEATVLSREHAVIMTGEFADAPRSTNSARVNRLGRWYKPWFYRHVAALGDGGGEEYVPLADYLLRHNRSIFWVVADMIPFGNHPAFRFALGWLMPPRIAFLKVSTTAAVRKMTVTMQVFQDIVLPMSAMARALDLTHRLFGMHPILLYPSLVMDHGQLQGQLRAPPPGDRVPGRDAGMYFDLGVYGVPAPIRAGRRFRTVHAMRRMEEFVREVGGYPFLYADTFMSREEFEKTFDLRLYEKVRLRYGADGAFPHLYDKTKTEVDVAAILAEEASWPDGVDEANP
jgi:delta24-sterol reductase